MGAPQLLLLFLLTGCFSLSTWLAPRFEKNGPERDTGFLASFMGESRRLFANHFFVRSDVYFHSGYYPSIFDQGGKQKENHLSEHAETGDSHVHNEHCDHDQEKQAGHEHSKSCGHGEGDFLGKPKDFLDAFSRHFFVSTHTHLNDKGTNGAREILPWLKLSAELDPYKVETYTVGAFWLRELKKPTEAELFLRDGLRFNPDSYELLFELGRCRFERGELTSARNLWELSVRRWHEQQDSRPEEERDRFALLQSMINLARLEAKAGRRDAAIRWLELVQPLSPVPAEIGKRIEEVKSGRNLEAGAN